MMFDGFRVAMDQPLVVGVLQTGGDLGHQAGGARHLSGPPS